MKLSGPQLRALRDAADELTPEEMEPGWPEVFRYTALAQPQAYALERRGLVEVVSSGPVSIKAHGGHKVRVRLTDAGRRALAEALQNP